MPHKINQHYYRLLILFFIAIFLIAACSRGQSGAPAVDSGAAESAPAAPTMPSGNFVAVGEQSILSNTARLTQTVQITQATQASSGAAPDLQRGEAAYTKNKCGDCHGANGEGVPDKGNTLVGMTLTLQEFDAVLRTGGGLGNTHIFGRSAVSPSGMEALYAYTQSLGQ